MIKKSINYLLLMVSFAIPLVGYWQKQNLYDWYKLRNYSPNARISQLALSTTMNSYGKKLFFVNYPEIDNKDAFHSNCTLSEATIVLGCFVSNKGIFLYDVTDKRLSGVHEVTAAHETLHAAYERLSAKEKKNVNALTSSFYATLNNDRIKSTIEQYNKRDPSSVPNELHSILGTEIEILSPELESYYKKYFTDRSKIVAFSEQYEAVFSELKIQVDKLDATLVSLKLEIDSLESQVDILGKELEAQRENLNSLINQNKVDQYNSAVPSFNQRVSKYNSLIGTVKSKVNNYNTIVEQRNALATEQKTLINAIDSRTIDKK